MKPKYAPMKSIPFSFLGYHFEIFVCAHPKVTIGFQFTLMDYLYLHLDVLGFQITFAARTEKIEASDFKESKELELFLEQQNKKRIKK